MKYFILFVFAIVSFSGPVHGNETALKVVSSIKPVHSLVAGVMKGAGEPQLLVKGGSSPHSYSLKPSDANVLEKADLVFWIGPMLESFLEKPIANIASESQIVTLSQIPEVKLLAPRSGGTFDEHAHHEEHEEHEEHAKHDEHDEHEEDEEHDEDKDTHFDLHIWLDPGNGLIMVNEIAEALSAADPENGKIYRANATKIGVQLSALSDEIDTILAPVRNQNFIVFHDAYQYFENAFDFAAAGSLTINPETAPGAKRISEIRERIQETNSVCIFSEPQFQSSILKVLGEDGRIKIGELDPLGTNLANGPDLYFDLIRGLAASLHDCLATTSTQ